MEDKELNLVDHLEELRKRIIISALAFVVFFIAGFIYVDDIYRWFVGDMKLMVLGLVILCGFISCWQPLLP